MPGFLYFLPHVTAAELTLPNRPNVFDPAALARWDLHSVLTDVTPEDCLMHEVQQKSGPDDQTGVYLAPQTVERSLLPRLNSFDGDLQSWTSWQLGADTLWVWFDRHNPPGPDDLVRRRTVANDYYQLEMGDGRKWSVPVIRRALKGDTPLPQTVGWSPVGRVTTQIDARYVDLWRAACDTWDVIYGGKDAASLDYETQASRVLQALQLVYRVGRPEVTLLGLFNTQVLMRALQAMIDLPNALALVEKKSDLTPASSSPPESVNSGAGSIAE